MANNAGPDSRTAESVALHSAFIILRSDVVPRKGFEPPHHCWRQDLNLVRLPIPPPGRERAILAEHVPFIK